MASPNVILLTADGHRWDCLGYAGHPDVRTPNLDALAAHGLLFPEAICTHTESGPSKYSLLSGRLPYPADSIDPAAWPLLPAQLRAAGYTTAAVGHLEFDAPSSGLGLDVVRQTGEKARSAGRDDYVAWLATQGITESTAGRPVAALTRAFGVAPSGLPANRHVTAWTGNQAIRFLQSVREPFFLWVAFGRPAAPYDPPSPWDDAYVPGTLSLPAGWRNPALQTDTVHFGGVPLHKLRPEVFREVMAHYYAGVSLVDQHVGRILATLAARGFTNNLISYCGTGGDYMGQHGLVGSCAHLPYDTLLRVPFHFAGVVGQHRGTQDPAPVSLLDVAPTLLDAAGLAVPNTMDGTSLLARAHGATTPIRSAAAAVGPDGLRILRGTRYKLVESPAPGIHSLYDLHIDPHEYDNLYGKPAFQKTQLAAHQLLNHTLARVGSSENLEEGDFP